MAKLHKGIFGMISGRVGDLVFTTYRGASVVRRRPVRKKPATSPAVLAQQARFRLMVRFLKLLVRPLDKTFERKSNQTGFNQAVSWNMRNAVAGTYPDFTVDYSSLLLSSGSLTGPESPKVSSPSEGRLVCRWQDYLNWPSRASDQLLLFVFCESMGGWGVLRSTATRKVGCCTVNVDQFSGKSVQTWAAFISADGKLVSKSVYMGEIKVR